MWRETVKTSLSLFGHRNWIVIADAAYPAHSSPGIETVLADADPISITRVVLEGIQASGHVRASVYTDLELAAVAEEDAPGVSAFREALHRVLGASDHKTVPHEEIIARLDEASRRFRVLIVKSPVRMPYTSVFIELECGYWTGAAERRLRESMDAHAERRS